MRRLTIASALIFLTGSVAGCCCAECADIARVAVQASDGTPLSVFTGEVILEDERWTIACPGASSWQVTCDGGGFTFNSSPSLERICLSLASGGERFDKCMELVWRGTGERECASWCERADVTAKLAAP